MNSLSFYLTFCVLLCHEPCHLLQSSLVVYKWGVLGRVVSVVPNAPPITSPFETFKTLIELIYSRESSLLKCLWIIIIVYLWPLRPLFKLYHDLCFIDFMCFLSVTCWILKKSTTSYYGKKTVLNVLFSDICTQREQYPIQITQLPSPVLLILDQ